MGGSYMFSIIIPVYNVALYLPECINSVLGQDYKQYELILIDDGSTDESGNICDEYAKNNSCIKVIHQTNQGLSDARNKGIDIAQGEYVIFLDSDDLWHDNRVLNKIDLRLQTSHAEVLSFNYVKFCEEVFEKPYLQYDVNMPLEMLGKKSFEYHIKNDLWIACAWNKAIKRNLFDNGNLRFGIGITSEDVDWCFRLALKATCYDYIADVVVCYRQRNASISKNITLKKIDTLIDNIEVCLFLMKNEKDTDKLYSLKPYIGYQYGTAFYLVSSIKDKIEYNRLINRLREKVYILKWSQNRKIRMLKIANDIGGIWFTIFLLKIRDRLK